MNHKEDVILYINSLDIYLFIYLSNHIFIYVKSIIYHLPIYHLSSIYSVYNIYYLSTYLFILKVFLGSI